MSKNQYYVRLLSPWCIKYFFHRLFSVFSFIFCPVSPQTKASNGGENSFDIKNHDLWHKLKTEGGNREIDQDLILLRKQTPLIFCHIA